MGCGGSRALPVATNNHGGGDVETHMLTASSTTDSSSSSHLHSSSSNNNIPNQINPLPGSQHHGSHSNKDLSGIVSGNHSSDNNDGTSGGSPPTSPSSSSSTGRGSMTGNVKNPTNKATGDSAVAVALRSKRKGILVEGTSVQPDAQFVKKVIPKSSAVREMIALALSGNVLFGALGQSALEDMIDAMELKDINANTILMSQGEQGDNFYVIESGKFEIIIGDKKVADWGEGTNNKTVGELALLYGAPRAATVKATTDGRTWYIDRTTFRNITAQGAYASHQQLKAALRKGILEELSDHQLDKVAAAANRVRFTKGAQIIKKGDVGEVFYIIETGSVICKNLPGEQITNVLEAGDYFGERALMKREPRVCDVYAHTDTNLIAVSREDFESLLGQIGDLLEQNLGMRLLLCVPILQQLKDEHRAMLFSQVKILIYKPNQIIVQENSLVNQFFIIKEGEVRITVSSKENIDKPSNIKVRQKIQSSKSVTSNRPPVDGEIGTLSAGQWFGEDDIDTQVPSPATYLAVGTVQCFVIESDTFEVAVAPYLNRTRSVRSIGAAGDSRQHESKTAELTLRAPEGQPRGNRDTNRDGGRTTEIRGPRARLGLPFKELDQRATLGTGTFGRVRLVHHRKTNRVFALKMLKKAQIVALRQQANIMNEKDLLMRVDHPFIIKLYDTYKDRDRLYMLMELVQGGELFARLQNSITPGRITPTEARFYAGCVLDAFEHLHSLSIVYRDLKPENLLIDSDGYLKIVDFGFAKIVKDRTYTLCGTPEYLAPELVLGKGHDKGVDYWALGILLYEQVAGYSPFADSQNNDQMVICRKILRGDVEFPPHFKDSNLKDLILRLLVKEIPKRLGCLRGGAQDIKEHRFFRGLEFDSLVHRKLPAPWKPELTDPLDTHHFDEYDEEDDVEPYNDDGTNWEKDF